MFRFTIRDVLWLTVVVALSLTVWNERQKLNKAMQWRDRAGALEAALTDEDGVVDVSFHDGCVVVWARRDGVDHHVRRYSLKGYAPSPEE